MTIQNDLEFFNNRHQQRKIMWANVNYNENAHLKPQRRTS